MIASSPPKIRTVIHGRPMGNLGNQMLQFMLLTALGQRIQGVALSSIELPIWRIAIPARFPQTSKRVLLEGQYVDTELLARLSVASKLPEVEFKAYGFQLDNYLPSEHYQPIFPVSGVPEIRDLATSLVINVRGAEILGGEHPDYGPIPIEFYKFVIDATGLSPVFMGQLGADWYSIALRREFPAATFIESFGVEGDFALLRAARHVVMSVSTFSWLACWLSKAQTIHLPVLGFLNPRQRPDVDLLPINDIRYVFYRFPVRKWTGSAEQVAKIHSPYLGSKIETDELKLLLGDVKKLIARRLVSLFKCCCRLPLGM